ncbi:MAG: hypothetical protein H8D78_05395, partial [Chloroflexi bacterium]|nr:hypothetical protein [Chloroflexota bacterium]
MKPSEDSRQADFSPSEHIEPSGRIAAKALGRVLHVLRRLGFAALVLLAIVYLC